jgi:DNA mismatch repair ATPase MutS
MDTILYRQSILKDCLKHPLVVRELYALTVETIEKKKRDYWGFIFKSPGSILRSSVDVLPMFVTMLKRLRAIADTSVRSFDSDGFKTFFAMLKNELGDDYFVTLENHLRELKFRDGVLISAKLGEGNKGTNYVLRSSNDKSAGNGLDFLDGVVDRFFPSTGKGQGWVNYLLRPKSQSYSIYIHPRDESGWNALSDLRDRGLNIVGNALAQSTDHILSFFKMLRVELAFYVGCLNLHDRLAQKGEPVCFPVLFNATERRHSFHGLYDVCLSLSLQQRAVGNDVNADGKDLTVITGANKGGKSTFLRSIGLAQLMMQCGMFVPAASFSANLCSGVFTHYKREEDATMKSGKLDEELSRMSEMTDHLTSNAILLFNESFAATNEREGSEISEHIVSALLEKRMKVFFVTHLYEFAHACFTKRKTNAIFLRAERQSDGSRTFKLVAAEPLETSYGEDLYNEIFIASEKGYPHQNMPVVSVETAACVNDGNAGKSP